MEDTILHNIALTLVPDVGPVLSKVLISYCGSAEAVLKSSRKTLEKIPQIGPAIASKIVASDTYAAA